jgi:hypothetical protein
LIAQIEDLELDTGIVDFVRILQESGIETTESCQGGEGHTYPEPTVRFCGDNSEGFRALAVAMQAQLPVAELRRVWSMQGGEPTGPEWELVFYAETPPGPWTPAGFRD